MDMKTKYKYAEQAIKNISTADDVDSALRSSALSKLFDLIEAEQKALEERVAAKLEAADIE